MSTALTLIGFESTNSKNVHNKQIRSADVTTVKKGSVPHKKNNRNFSCSSECVKSFKHL